jgi:acetaldehyde dehydrogenase (acetylating)
MARVATLRAMKVISPGLAQNRPSVVAPSLAGRLYCLRRSVYLPKYAGNLDIMTAAAARTAEMFAEEIIAGRLTLKATVAPAATPAFA